MSSINAKDRVSLCRYTYADHRKCLTPRSPAHPHFCYFHARRESQSVATEKLAEDLAYFFSGQYISANDLCYAMGRLIPAVVRGDIKPRTASTLAYLAQTFIQAIQLAQKEYTYAFGTPEWAAEIRNNVSGNVNRLNQPETSSPNSNGSEANLANDQSETLASSDDLADVAEAPEFLDNPTEAEAQETDTETESSNETATPKNWHPACPVPNGEHSEGSAAVSSPCVHLQRPPADRLTPLEATLAKN